MVAYKIKFSQKALNDKKKIDKAKLSTKVKTLLDLMVNDPFCYPPSYEKLTGDLTGYYSRRINLKHRLVYTVNEEDKEIYIVRMWTHYDKVK